MIVLTYLTVSYIEHAACSSSDLVEPCFRLPIICVLNSPETAMGDLDVCNEQWNSVQEEFIKLEVSKLI